MHLQLICIFYYTLISCFVKLFIVFLSSATFGTILLPGYNSLHFFALAFYTKQEADSVQAHI